MTLKKMIGTAAMLLITMTMSAQNAQWMDVTDRFMKNPAFDGDSSEGWDWDSNASTQAVRVECISFYHGNFDLYQQLRGLPKGKYRLTVQGFYRTTNNETAYAAHQDGTEEITASLYAGTVNKKLVSLYSASLDYNAAGRCYERDGKFYPDGKEAALEAFGKGLYVNTLEFEAEGSVLIGVRCDDYMDTNYCVLDNFKLEYSSPMDGDGKMWIDMTSQLLKNPGFDDNDPTGWTFYSGASSQTLRCECMEFWNGWYDIFQEVRNAPKGKYRLSVQAYYRCQDNPQDYRDYKNGAQNMTGMLFVEDYDKEVNYEQPIVSVYTDSLKRDVGGCWSPGNGAWYPNTMESASYCFDQGYYWNTMEFEVTGDFAVGMYCWDQKYSNWCIFDNFKLEYYGNLVKVNKIDLGTNHTDWIVGESGQLTATVLPKDATIQMVEWSSSNEKVATVSVDGLVTAVGQGTVTITAKALDGSGVVGTMTITVGRNQAAPGSIIINEIMASNVDEYLSPAFNFDGWIELYNPTERAVELGGLLISDPTNEEGPWKVPQSIGVLPAKGFRLIWFDSNVEQPKNAPFKLDTDGGTILICDANNKEIVRQEYPASMERVSYARVEDGTGEWGFTDKATPGDTNKGIKTFTTQLAAPVVNQPSQLFTGTVSLSVDIPAGTSLRFTTDGTLPTRDNGKTSTNGQFRISESSIYRFRLFANNALASPVTTRSFIQRDRDYTLPVVSVVSDLMFLYSTEYGVMTTGPNGRPGNGQSQKCNWNMDWERPVNFSYLTADGEMVLNQDVNLEMCGGWSRAWTPHSFKLKGSKELGGDKNLQYPFFEQKPYIRNRTLQIRNGGNDNGCRIKDASLQYIVSTANINIDYQSYQPIHEFINQSYMGVLNMREPNNKHFVYANYGWDEEDIDQFEISPDSNYVQKCGTADAYEELLALSANAADPVVYNEICTRLLDMDAYINYMALELYLGNNDWPKNNIKGFRHRDGGKFRFVVFDLDHSFNSSSSFSDFFSKERWTFDTLYPSGKRLTETITFVTLFKNLLKNETFRRQFIDAFCLMGGSVFETSRSSKIIDELVNRVEPAMSLEWGSAKSTANSVKNNLKSRLSNSTSSLKGYATFGLSKVTTQRVTLDSNQEGAQLYINGLQVPTGRFDGNLFAPVTLKAQAPAGYTFKGWVDNTGKVKFTDEEISLPVGKVILTATYEKMSESEARAQGYTPVRINEVSGSNDCYIDEYGKKGDWVELYNASDKEIDVEGMFLTDNLTKLTKYQITKGNTKAKTKIPAHGYLIIWCDNKRETTDRGLHANFKIDGDGGQLALTAADKSWTDVMTYGAHDANTTVVRFPDGSNDVFTTNVVTIAKNNLKTSYMAKVEQTGTGVSHATVASSANGFRLRYGSGLLFVKSEEAQQAVVDIYTAGGQLVEHAVVDILKGTARVDVSHLPAGFYVARAVSDEGTRVSCKFMK